MYKKDEMYKIVDEFQKSLAKSGFPPEPIESIDPLKEIPKINQRINFLNKILIVVITVLGIAFLSFIIDAIYFHITNNKYFENVYELKNDQQQQIDDMQLDLKKIKEKHPEFF